MPDEGINYTDKTYDELVRRFNGIFRDAQEEIIKNLNEHTAKMIQADKEKRALVKAGEMTEAAYKSWLAGQMFTQRLWQDKLTSVASTLMQADKQCRDIVDGAKRAVFGENANYQYYLMEHKAGLDLGFTLYDSATVTRLFREQPELMPRKVIDGEKQEAWEQKKIANAITTGIILGESIPKIAERIARETAQANSSAVVRYARTTMTAAQNAGRLEAMEDALKMGIKTLKVWIAVLDDRTRDAHAELDGQTRDIKEPFESILGDIMYPGDPNADEANIWNCRCALGWDYKEYPNKEYLRLDNIDGEPIEYMTYNDWQKAKNPEAYEKRIEREKKLIEAREKAKAENAVKWTREEYEDAKAHKDEILKQEKEDIEKWFDAECDKLVDKYGGPFISQRIAVKKDDTLTEEEKGKKLEEIENKRQEYIKDREKLKEERDKKYQDAYDKRDYVFDLDYEYPKIETPFDAFSNAKEVNPNFDWVGGDFAYTHNCQRCAVAFEVRERGYDVVALGASSAGGYGAEAEIVHMFKEASRLEFDGRGHSNTEAVRNQMREWGDGSRAIITIRRDGGMTGHAFNAEYKDGTFFIIDSQLGACWDDKKNGAAIDGGCLEDQWTNHVTLYRTDNVRMRSVPDGWIEGR